VTAMIRTTRLTKRFGPTVALADIDLQIARGECLGLTGPNGGGRTTLLRILATLLRPSAGLVEIDGTDVVGHAHQVRSRLVYVGGERPKGDGLGVREYLTFVADARRARGNIAVRPGVDDVLDRANLPADTSVDALSAGLRQRVALAAALLIAPAVMLLDDPFQSLDFAARGLFTEWLRETRDSGTTLVVAFNDGTPTKTLCHRVAQLDRGHLISDSQVAPTELQGTPLAALGKGEA